MVRLLNRLIEPTRGQVLIDGVDIAKMSDAELREVRRKKIAMVFQSFALMPHMSVLDNTAFGMALAGNQEKEGHSPYELLHEDFPMLSQIQRFGGAMFTPRQTGSRSQSPKTAGVHNWFRETAPTLCC